MQSHDSPTLLWDAQPATGRQAGSMAERWSPDHLRLHRLLRRRPDLLPQGSTLLLAVSGGQDSMALLGLLADLRRLHHWQLQLWHGDHGWRMESGRQAAELAAWAEQRGLTLHSERWSEPQASEAAAREWRYGCLSRLAGTLAASRVVTGHTASDRAETLLLQLARGSHRRGLGSPRALRPLQESPEPGSVPVNRLQLARPLLQFSRADTARLCSALELPIWPDPSNTDPAYGRNRIRQEVLPVLEALHPGASRRLCGLSERLAEEEESLAELADLALQALAARADARVEPGPAGSLERRPLMALAPANRRRLLRRWLEWSGGPGLAAESLELVLQRLAAGQPPGRLSLAGNLELQWNRERIWLAGHGPLP